MEELVVAGDLVSRGPRDAESVDLVRGLSATVIAGNTDLNVVASNYPWAKAVRAELGPSRVDYLANLPLESRITPPGGRSPDEDLLVVHATPTDPRAALILEDPIYGHPGTPPAEAAALIGATRANLIVSGHLHYAQAGMVGPQRFETIAPVSFASDGDPRAGYALAAWDGSTWQLNNRRVSYDVEAVAVEIERARGPKADHWAHQLRTAIVRGAVRSLIRIGRSRDDQPGGRCRGGRSHAGHRQADDDICVTRSRAAERLEAT